VPCISHPDTNPDGKTVKTAGHAVSVALATQATAILCV
jgi:hypothetical protein